MSLRTPILGALLLLLMVGAPAAAQEPGAAPPPDTTQNAALRAFLDCDERGCDREFLVTELKWINFMRDRLDADFHILVTSQQTGSGGRQYAVVAIGQRAYAGKVDTLTFVTNPNDANDLIRRQLLRVIGQLLLPHAAQGPLGSQLTIAYAAPTGAASGATAAARDRWNFWTFSISANGFLNGESRQSFRNGWTNLSANRTTEAWMVRLNANASYDESKFTFELQPGTDTTIVALQRSSGFSGMAVKSINDHWSAGGRASVERSDFQNLDLGSQAAAAIEWNFFPYQEFARRKLALLYTIGVRNNQYKEITIYDRLSETRPMHTFDATFGARQPWGQANVTLYGRQFLDEFKYYSAGLRGGVEVRLGRGLSFNVDGSLSRVRDQLYLERGGATQSQVLTRLRALQTNYRYFTFFGIRYQFGSIFNSVVNPRFGNIGGGNEF
jgi:hypothetical protein